MSTLQQRMEPHLFIGRRGKRSLLVVGGFGTQVCCAAAVLLLSQLRVLGQMEEERERERGRGGGGRRRKGGGERGVHGRRRERHRG
jgi:hypothetical protein